MHPSDQRKIVDSLWVYSSQLRSYKLQRSPQIRYTWLALSSSQNLLQALSTVPDETLLSPGPSFSEKLLGKKGPSVHLSRNSPNCRLQKKSPLFIDSLKETLFSHFSLQKTNCKYLRWKSVVSCAYSSYRRFIVATTGKPGARTLENRSRIDQKSNVSEVTGLGYSLPERCCGPLRKLGASNSNMLRVPSESPLWVVKLVLWSSKWLANYSNRHQRSPK